MNRRIAQAVSPAVANGSSQIHGRASPTVR